MNHLRLALVITLAVLAGCGGGGGSSPVPAPVPVSVTCPNGTTQTAATLDLANGACPMPLLVSVSPTNANAAVLADTFASVDVVTDSTLDATSITATSVTLKAGSAAIAGTVSTVGTKGLKFVPTAKLSYAQAYTFAAAVKDTLGRTLVINSTFTTASISCVPPQIPNSTGTGCDTPLFSSTPILLPDLKAKYDALCGAQVNVQNAIPIHLNGHTRTDLVFNLWCPHTPTGEAYIGPTLNTLVALVQNADGTFTDQTKEIFGSDIVDVGGAGYGYVVADFNGDGYDDIVFAVNHEDGRYPSDVAASNMNSQAVAFMSNGKGQYTNVRFGTPRWGDDVRLTKDVNGNNQVVLLPADSSAELWIFNGAWAQVAGYDWLQKNPVFINSPTAINSPTMIVNKFNNGQALEVWSDASATWSRLINYPYLAPLSVPFVHSDGTIGTTNIFHMDGNDYIDYGGLYEGCSAKRTSNGSPEAIYTFLGQLIPGGYSGQTLYDNWAPPTIKIVSLGVNVSNANINPVTLLTDKLDGNFYHIVCFDMNGDGLDDILIRTAGSPIIYINHGNGGYGKLNPTAIPKVPSGASEIYVDIDGDGNRDLLYFPITGWQFESGGYSKVQFLLYKGNRNIVQFDLINVN